jgi:hypothetical protein
MSEMRKGEGNPCFGRHEPWTPERHAAYMARTVEHHTKRPEVRKNISSGKRAQYKQNPLSEEEKSRLGEIGRNALATPEARERHRIGIRRAHEKRKAKAA